jgi:hypothetical protein
MNEILQQMQDALPDFIDEKYEKGISKDRGKAMVACIEFILWFKEHYEKNPNFNRMSRRGENRNGPINN